MLHRENANGGVRSVKRKGGVLPVVFFCGRLENRTFTLDENSCRANLTDQIGPIVNCIFQSTIFDHRASLLSFGLETEVEGHLPERMQIPINPVCEESNQIEPIGTFVFYSQYHLRPLGVDLLG